MALSKTIKLDPEVLSVIRGMSWEAGGTVGRLTETLERDLYLKVNKALEAMGGHWDRKVSGHVFEKDPREQVEGLLENGQLVVAKEGFFETPPEVVDQMISLLGGKLSGMVLEPSAGKGAILHKIAQHPIENCFAVEKNEDRYQYLTRTFSPPIYAVLGDYMVIPFQPEMFDYILMNPPFENHQDIDHVRRAYDMLAKGGKMAAIMCENAFMQSRTTKVKDFADWLLNKRVQFIDLPEDTFAVQARLLVFQK